MDGSIVTGVIGENGEVPVGPLPNGVIPESGVPPTSFGI